MAENLSNLINGLAMPFHSYGEKRKNWGEGLIAFGSVVFALGVPWSHVFGYMGLAIALLGGFLYREKFSFEMNIKAVLFFMILFFLWGIVLTFTVSKNANFGLNTVFAYFAHWMAPFILGCWLAPRLKIPVLIMWVGSMFVLGLFSLMAFAGLFNDPSLSKEGMLWGRHHHIQFAAVLFIAFQILYGLFMTPETSRKQKIFLAAFGVLILLFFILTGSRGWWMAAGFSLIGITLHHIYINRSRRIAILMTVLGLVLVVSSIIIFPQVRARINQTSLNDPNLIYRRNMAIMAVNVIRDHPFAGIGPGQVPFAKEYYDRMEKMNLPQETGYLKKTHFHNMYLQITAEFGFPGLILFLVILGAIFRLLIKSARRNNNGLRTGIIYGMIWSLVAVLIAETLDCLLRGPAVAMEMFWALGICAGFGYDKNKLNIGPVNNQE